MVSMVRSHALRHMRHTDVHAPVLFPNLQLKLPFVITDFPFYKIIKIYQNRPLMIGALTKTDQGADVRIFRFPSPALTPGFAGRVLDPRDTRVRCDLLQGRIETGDPMLSAAKMLKMFYHFLIFPSRSRFKHVWDMMPLQSHKPYPEAPKPGMGGKNHPNHPRP